MFEWITKKIKAPMDTQITHPAFEDSIEEALWEVKEQFDLETEEVEKTVLDKRQNIEYMRKTLKRDL
jgi:predicted phosphoribosyltransferase